jgi:hypothetical protein
MSDSPIDLSDVHGPIDFLLLEFSPDRMDGSAAAAILDLIENGIIRLYDLLVISKDADGTCVAIDISAVGPEALGGFGDFAGAQSGLLSDDDIAEAGAAMTPGTAAALLVYENAWAVPFVAAAANVGAEVIASARIPATVIMDVLDELDHADSGS